MNASELFQFVRLAFLRKSQSEPKTSKHRPAGTAYFGKPDPDAKTAYLAKRTLHPGRASSLKKLQRAERIGEGLRPLTFDVPGKRERKTTIRSKRKAVSDAIRI